MNSSVIPKPLKHLIILPTTKLSCLFYWLYSRFWTVVTSQQRKKVLHKYVATVSVSYISWRVPLIPHTVSVLPYCAQWSMSWALQPELGVKKKNLTHPTPKNSFKSQQKHSTRQPNGNPCKHFYCGVKCFPRFKTEKKDSFDDKSKRGRERRVRLRWCERCKSSFSFMSACSLSRCRNAIL